jgi:hypothetical protein
MNLTKSQIEELIAALWAICALLAFGFGHPILGWIFTTKAALDTYCSIKVAIQEIVREREHELP